MKKYAVASLVLFSLALTGCSATTMENAANKPAATSEKSTPTAALASAIAKSVTLAEANGITETRIVDNAGMTLVFDAKASGTQMAAFDEKTGKYAALPDTSMFVPYTARTITSATDTKVAAGPSSGMYTVIDGSGNIVIFTVGGDGEIIAASGTTSDHHTWSSAVLYKVDAAARSILSAVTK